MSSAFPSGANVIILNLGSAHFAKEGDYKELNLIMVQLFLLGRFGNRGLPMLLIDLPGSLVSRRIRYGFSLRLQAFWFVNCSCVALALSSAMMNAEAASASNKLAPFRSALAAAFDSGFRDAIPLRI